MGDNRETVAQRMYGKSEDDLEREEQVEMKRNMEGKAPTEQQETAEHEAAVRAGDESTMGTQDWADNLHRSTRGDTPTDQMAVSGRMDAADVRREYPQGSMGVTKEAASDKKP